MQMIDGDIPPSPDLEFETDILGSFHRLSMTYREAVGSTRVLQEKIDSLAACPSIKADAVLLDKLQRQLRRLLPELELAVSLCEDTANATEQAWLAWKQEVSKIEENLADLFCS